MDTLTSLDPQSPHVRAIVDLWRVAVVVCGAIFAIVAGLVFYALLRYRWREGELDPRQLAGNRKIEIAWTAIPFLIVIVLFTMTERTMSLSDPPPAPSPDLVVVGHQWWWEARYPASGVVTANEIHIPVGKPLSVRLDSTDVLHEFWVPQLARKMTTVPGHPNNIWMEADKAGVYPGVCSEFCGTQHAWMHFLVVAEEPAAFERWERGQLQPAPAAAPGPAARGLAIFEGSTCIACHAIHGVPGADARVGPDLTHFGARRQLGAGVAENSPENLGRWLLDPQKIKPGVNMPNFNLTQTQVNDLIAYFKAPPVTESAQQQQPAQP